MTELLGSEPWHVHPSLATLRGPPPAVWSSPIPPGREDTGAEIKSNVKTTKKQDIFRFIENIHSPIGIPSLLDPINVISIHTKNVIKSR